MVSLLFQAAISVFKSVAIVVYTQYITGQSVSSLATVLNRLASGGSRRRLSQSEAGPGSRQHPPLSARQLLRELSSSSSGSDSGDAVTPPLNFSNTGTLSVLMLLSQQDMMDAAASAPAAAVAAAEEASPATAYLPSAVSYLPTALQSLGVSSIASIASLYSGCSASEDITAALQTSIVAQGYLSGLLNDLANNRVSTLQFQRQASAEVRRQDP